MTGTWSGFTARQKEAARQAYLALAELDRIREAECRRDRVERRVGFGDLHAFVIEPDRPMSSALAQALENTPRLRDDLERLLAKIARYHAPKLAAASSGVAAERVGPGFHLALRPSRAEPSQVYVVIELAELVPGLPRALFVTGHRDRLIKQRLPEAQGNTIQILAEANSELIQALEDPNSEVFLR